jgi:CRISPR-associated protein Csd1
VSVLASLVRAYDRLATRGEVPAFGYSQEKIGFLISLNANGTPAGKPIDLRTEDGKKKLPRPMAVPQPVKRTSGISPNFLWDKTAYALGVTAAEGKRTPDEHAAFVARHRDLLAGTNDAGLGAFLTFIENWTPKDFVRFGWSEEMKNQNVVFTLESERRQDVRLHDRQAARDLWSRLSSGADKSEVTCLVTGERGPVARLHPSVKGVWGAQTAGASIVSFNLDAFTSYGHEQGDNAPVSEAAAFAYTTALNKFLESGSRNRIQIGDASTVFWADASDAETAEEAEGVFAALFTDIDEATQATKVGVLLEKIRLGRPLQAFAPELEKGVRFYILGLAPNAARLSIRFWLETDFGTLANHYLRFVADMRIEPAPRDPHPALWKYLAEIAVLGKRENVPPNLAGEWMRAILTGTSYPLTLLSTVLMRLRADKHVNALRVSILKSLLIRNYDREVPVALDPANTDKGYLLGRLFAVYEHVQTAALGSKINATIKDKFYGAASAQPRKVFSLLEKSSANHLSKVGKLSPGRKVNLQKEIGEIMAVMQPGADPFPAALSTEEQALFGLGYYHQRNELFRSQKDDAVISEETVR